jgi:hypothetical protein
MVTGGEESIPWPVTLVPCPVSVLGVPLKGRLWVGGWTRDVWLCQARWRK